MQKIKLITLDPTLPSWPSLPRKLSEVISELNTMRNADFSIEVEYRDLIPEVREDGRITHEWMDSISWPALREGYNFVAVHMGDQQRRDLGIHPLLRGAHQVDYDLVHETYFWADEKTLRVRRNQFIQTFLHELRHGLRRGMKLYDDTHDQHADGDIRGSFVGMDMADYSPRNRNIERQFALWWRALAYISRLVSLRRPYTLYRAATARLGTDASPEDRAPDMLSCAESVSNVIRDVLPNFPIITGTWTLWDKLERDPRFERVSLPMPGTIIIAPTGTVKADIPGHVGIYGQGDTIMSSTSATGLFEANYTTDTWQKRYGTAGYTSYLYQLKI